MMGPAYCTHGLRAPASYAPYVVPKAQGSCSPPAGARLYVRCARTSLGRAARTTMHHVGPRPHGALTLCVPLESNMVVGPLGSFTIVGSASFNLFVISAVCTAGMPKGD
eukprot:scaffold79741_cov50-Phaeocystis_antarctica.AAC.6